MHPFEDEMRECLARDPSSPRFSSPCHSVFAGILLHSICSQRKSIPEEGKRGQLLQGPREPSATAEEPRVAQDPVQSSGSEEVRQDGA